METDASDASIGGILQIKNNDGDFLPVAYESRKLTDGKCWYPIHDKELLAIVHCLVKWCCYLERQEEFTALTDHKLLIYFRTQANLSCRQARWMELLERFNMLIQYKSGAKLAMADALSRLYVCASRGENGLDSDWPLLVLQTKDKGFPPGTTDITK